MADSFLRVTLRDGSTHTVVTRDTDPAGLIEAAAKGQRWAGDGGWIEVEAGGAVIRKLVASSQVTVVELFERPS
jgi:hypothetical protein